MKYWRETMAVTQCILIGLLRRRRSLIFWSIFPISILILNRMILAERAIEYGFTPRRYGHDLAFWVPEQLEMNYQPLLR
ncbi:hypothetical protein NIES4073_35380 [Kalymmatonema gypsitolerans NIES-4073]|nr:hypothetical protein NIES4073_35380 [Scytonema sp. NIES-4073]